MLNFPTWKKLMVAFVCLMGILTAMPNFLSEEQRNNLPGFLPSQSLSLGLDLRGGLHMLIEAETSEVIEARLNNLVDQINGIRREVRGLNFRNIRNDGNSVVFEVTSPDMIELAQTELKAITEPSGVNPLAAGNIQEFTLERDETQFRLTLTEQGIRKQQQEAIARSMEVIRKRVDPDGVKEITLQAEGADRFILQIPGANDPEKYLPIINKTAKLGFHEVDLNVSPEDVAKGRVRSRQAIYPLKEGGQMVVNKRPLISGEDLLDAKPAFDERGQPSVSFTFNTRASKAFGDFTRDNVGRPFAIVLDEIIISAPRIISPILGGSGQITNMGTTADATELATLLKSGALPVKLTVASYGAVSADLGADSVAAGELAAAIGFVAVIIYMILSYGKFGLAANVALITNLVLITGALSLFQATLTLPGIAGIVLTIGMAVDANVLIFERIREEQRAGRNPFRAMEEGYGQAFSTIMDANITTFIAAAILYLLGSGPVQGFAVTLAIGILTSMFTAVVLTRLILSSWLRRAKPDVLPI
ncbi:protein translocase subunit SecD [Kordiimonas sp. SCSIO 12610]|uniref:protein translocase subunit SecD n=1 Tax=Kordiimonas sp. SCSIO 12610 TaxID=2829597 RepID=UPI00210C2B09|nr:protein translocase subunit SecD [Kordiimonas sp. SCSIO 12610]UTW54225.1 protein translocase subunit SecD [Kordiimonas sp. SCSIO 12610]